jgi:signal transduction histidine kinase
MNKRNIKYATLFIVFCTINLIIYIITNNNLNDKTEASLKSHIEKLDINSKIILKNQKRIADMAFDLTTKNKEVLNIFKTTKSLSKKAQADARDKLQGLVKNIYKGLKENGALQYHFTYKDNTTLLRMHKPSKYDDDLSSARLDVSYVNSTQKELHGFSESKTSHGFKHIYPVLDVDGTHLGAIDIAFTSDVLQNELNLDSNLYSHFLVNKNVFSAKVWERDDIELKYVDSKEHKDHKVTISKYMTPFTKKNASNSLDLHLDFIDKNIKKEKIFNFYTNVNNVVEVVSFVPIKHNQRDEISAWLVSYENDPFIYYSLKNEQYIRIGSFLLLCIIFYFLFRYSNEKELLRKIVDEKTKKVMQMNRELEESETELQLINENLENMVINEVDKNRKNQERLFEQAKLASMGEMIGNIAHQWRQPLNMISTGVTGLQMKKQLDSLNDEDFFNTCSVINDNAQYLSKTIDDFKHFIKGDRQKTRFDLNDNIESFLHLVEGSIKNHDITIIKDIEDDILIHSYPNELIQCFINLFNNAKDALEQIDDDRALFIKAEIKDNKVNIAFKDNAGGIPENILSQIFEPYFTTKHQSIGTGLGLSILHSIIIKGMNGSIIVDNTSFEYNDKKYNGAEFIIEFPLS